MRMLFGMTVVLVLAACGGDDKQRIELTYEDGTFFSFEPRNPDGTVSALSLKEDPSGNSWSWALALKAAGSTDPRAQQSVRLGGVAKIHPALVPGQGGVATFSGEGVESRIVEFKADAAEWKGDVTTPFLFRGSTKLRDSGNGRFVVGPRCAGDGERSNWGCGHKLPTDPSLPTKVVPPTTPFFLGDNCGSKGEFWNHATKETWTLEGNKLNLGTGTTLPCVKTDQNQLICGETRQMRAGTGNAQALCGYTMTTIAMPDFDPTDVSTGPQLIIFASANDESLLTTDSCYGFSNCYAGF